MNFNDLGSLQLCGNGGRWMGESEGMGVSPHICICMHAHAHTHACVKHDNFMQMAAPIGFFGESEGFPMMSYVYMCMCMPGTPTPAPCPPTYPWGTPRISENSITLDLIKIIQFCLKIYDCRKGGSMGRVRSNH